MLAACDAGEGTQAVALRFGCSTSWTRHVKQVRREQGKIAPFTTRQRIPLWMPLRKQIEKAHCTVTGHDFGGTQGCVGNRVEPSNALCGIEIDKTTASLPLRSNID